MASQLPLYFAGKVFISQKDVDVVDPVVLVPREERNLAFDGWHSDVFIDDTHQLRALLFETSPCSAPHPLFCGA